MVRNLEAGPPLNHAILGAQSCLVEVSKKIISQNL